MFLLDACGTANLVGQWVVAMTSCKQRAALVWFLSPLTRQFFLKWLFGWVGITVMAQQSISFMHRCSGQHACDGFGPHVPYGLELGLFDELMHEAAFGLEEPLHVGGTFVRIEAVFTFFAIGKGAFVVVRAGYNTVPELSRTLCRLLPMVTRMSRSWCMSRQSSRRSLVSVCPRKYGMRRSKLSYCPPLMWIAGFNWTRVRCAAAIRSPKSKTFSCMPIS